MDNLYFLTNSEALGIDSGNSQVTELKLGKLDANNIPNGITPNVPRIGSRKVWKQQQS